MRDKKTTKKYWADRKKWSEGGATRINPKGAITAISWMVKYTGTASQAGIAAAFGPYEKYPPASVEQRGAEVVIHFREGHYNDRLETGRAARSFYDFLRAEQAPEKFVGGLARKLSFFVNSGGRVVRIELNGSQERESENPCMERVFEGYVGAMNSKLDCAGSRASS